MHFYSDINIANVGFALSTVAPTLANVENSDSSAKLSEHLSDEGPVAPRKPSNAATQVSLAALEKMKEEERNRKVQSAVARINAKCNAMQTECSAMQTDTKEVQSLNIGLNQVCCASLISKLRFSQRTVSSKTSSGDTLDELQLSILKGWKKNSPLIVVKMPDGEYTSLDNRRLTVLKQIPQSSLSAMKDKVEIQVYDHTDKMGQMVLGGIMTPIKSNHSGSTVQKFEERLERHFDYRREFKYGTYGYGLTMRMLGSGATSPLDYGFTASPIVESSSKPYQRTNLQQRFAAIKDEPIKPDPFKD